MAGLKEINIRIKSVKNTKKITYAMKLVSATKMRSAQEAVLRSRDYSQAIENLMQSVLAASTSSELNHAFLEKRDLKKVKLIVLGASRGLCGAFNSHINKVVGAFYKEMAANNVEVDSVVCGSKQLEYFKREKLAYSEALTELPEKAADWPLDKISRAAEVEFESGKIDAVYVVYTHFKSALTMTATLKQLLPISIDDLNKESSEDSAAEVEVSKFEPSGEAVFAELLPRLVRMAMLQAALDTKASEHASRMTSMDNATKNAGDLIDSLTLKFNKLRQAGITSEILDIVGGANASSD